MYVFSTLQIVFAAGLPGVFSYFIPRLSDGQGRTLVNRFTVILGLLGAAFSAVLYFGATFIAQILNNPDLTAGLKIFSLVPLFTLPAMGIEGIYTALRKTKHIAFYLIISKTFNLICIVAPVLLLRGNYKTALTGWTIASFLIFLVALWMKNRPYVKIKPELISNMYKTVFTYSMPLMGASAVGMFLHSAGQFFISRFYGTAIFAEFSNGFIPVPLAGMVAGSVRSVLTPLFSKANFEGNMEQIFATYKSAVCRAVNIVFPVLFFCMFFAGDIMILLYGSQYAASKIYFQISITKDIIEVLPYLAILLAFGKSGIYFYIHLFGALSIWAVDALIVYNHLHPAYIAVAASAIQIIMISFVFWYFNTVLKIKLIKPVFKHLVVVSIHSSMLLVIVYGIRITFLSGVIAVWSLMACGTAFYILLILTDKIIRIGYLEPLFTLIKESKKDC